MLAPVLGDSLPVALAHDVTARRALAADVGSIVSLLAADPLGASRDGGDLAPYLDAFARIDGDPSELLVAVDDGGVVVGTMQLSLLPGLARRGALRLQLEAVRVATSHRGRGVGEAMFRWAVEEAERLGCALVQLTTDRSRLDAHRFYERLGFEPSHRGYKLHLRQDGRAGGAETTT